MNCDHVRGKSRNQCEQNIHVFAAYSLGLFNKFRYARPLTVAADVYLVFTPVDATAQDLYHSQDKAQNPSKTVTRVRTNNLNFSYVTNGVEHKLRNSVAIAYWLVIHSWADEWL